MAARLAMEEGNQETQALKIRNVRRRLFKEDEETSTTDERGSTDNEANRFMEEARGNLQRAKEKWNFDFEKEEPLSGRYEWVKAEEDFPSDSSISSTPEPNKNPNSTENSQTMKNDNEKTS